MRRRQQRLYEQPRQLLGDSRLIEAQNEIREQWQVRRTMTERVGAWWSDDDVGDATERVSMHWSMSSSQQETSGNGRRETENNGQQGTDDRGADGFQLPSTNNSTAPDGSWKTLGERKSCNGAQCTDTDEASPDIEVGDGATLWRRMNPKKIASKQLLGDPRSPRQTKLGDRRAAGTGTVAEQVSLENLPRRARTLGILRSRQEAPSESGEPGPAHETNERGAGGDLNDDDSGRTVDGRTNGGGPELGHNGGRALRLFGRTNDGQGK
ncbi:hypothetical protein DVH05_017818 [Phytophthora capsici]|nr:hypothetical protein DVH05_017818 [Phytophthora capsici]